MQEEPGYYRDERGGGSTAGTYASSGDRSRRNGSRSGSGAYNQQSQGQPSAEAYEAYGRDVNAPPPRTQRHASSSSGRRVTFSDEDDDYSSDEEDEEDRARRRRKKERAYSSSGRSKEGSRRGSSGQDDRRVSMGDSVVMVAKGIKQLVTGHK